MAHLAHVLSEDLVEDVVDWQREAGLVLEQLLHQERGKVVNYDKYEKYKEKEEERQKQERKRERSRSAEKKKKHKESEKYSSKKKKVYEISDSDSGSDSSPEVKRVKKSRRTWVQAGLKVRCVDSRMREGKYYNVKMEVIDVVTNDSCDCRTEEGKLL